jgi:hypothetical protein
MTHSLLPKKIDADTYVDEAGRVLVTAGCSQLAEMSGQGTRQPTPDAEVASQEAARGRKARGQG